MAQCRLGLRDAEGSQGGELRGQEVPFHRERQHPRSRAEGHGDLNQDEAHHRDPPELPALHQEIQPLREAPQQPGSPLLAGLRAQGGRHRDGGPVPTTGQDRPLQRRQGGQEPDLRIRTKAVRLVLRKRISNWRGNEEVDVNELS